jgi:transposase
VTKAKKTMGVLKILLSPDKDVEVLLNYLCQQSGKLYNSGVYLARQTFFKTGKLLTGKFDLSFEPSVSKSMVAKSLPSTPMQRTLYFKGQLHFRPKPPGYLKGSKLFKVAYPNSGGLKPTFINNQLRFSLGLTVKRWFGISEFFLPMPSHLDFSKVKEFTIVPKNGAFYLEVSYDVELQQHDLDNNQALSIDLGTADNLAACVDTLGNSFAY